MTKLSIAAAQQKLLETDENRKVHYDRMKANARMHAIGSLGNPSTQITSIKQVKMPGEVKRESGTHNEFVLQAEIAGNYIDKMGRGVFEDNSKNDGAPRSTPEVKRMTPNQTNKNKQVTPNMQKGRKSDSSNSQLWPSAQMAGNYVDEMPRGHIFSNNESSGGGVEAPKAKNLHGTTRPKSSQKTADLTRHPMKDQPAVSEPSDSMPMPKDAPPKKRPYEHVKSGVLVRVNESVKAHFDIVSTKVLKRIAESYQRLGYRVVFEQSNRQPAWKTDAPFLRLVREAVAAKHNQANSFEKRLTEAAWSRLYNLCKGDYNPMYESSDEFVSTIRVGLRRIVENALKYYRNNLNLFIGQARVIAENGATNDVEIISEATDHQMALRLIRNKLFEQFGLDTRIDYIFIDGTKYLSRQIKEWVPLAESSHWIQKTDVDAPGHKGGLHRALDVPAGQTIPRGKVARAAHSSDPHLRHMAQFAQNAR